MIRITYDARTTLPIDTLLDFQGDAKTITQENLDKLKRSIQKHGFFVPMFVWRKTANGKTYIIDGHQRLKALVQLRDEGEEIPPVPVEFITAKSKKDAAEKLLVITSQFGAFDYAGLQNFIEDMKIVLADTDIRLVDYEINLTIDEFIPDNNITIDEDELAKISHECPSCGFTW